MSRANEFMHPVSYDPSCNTHYGLTIREHFAAMAMSSLASHHTQGDHTMHEVAAKQAVRFADALLAALAKPVSP